jgi:TRAP-type C4-dicarboxylate transport system substrate-binding protein
MAIRDYIVVNERILVIQQLKKPTSKPAEEIPAPAPAPAKSYKWRLSAALTATEPSTVLMRSFADKVKAASNGRLDITVYDSGALGDWLANFEEVMKGTIEFQLPSWSTVHDPRLEIVWMPYMVKNWTDVRKAYSPGAWLFDTAAKMNRELGVEVIASVPSSFIGMGAKKMPPSPGDPNVPKNMKIRVWGAISPEKMMTRFGYLPTIMPWAEVFTALQSGVVEAIYGGDVLATYDTVRDAIKFWLPYNGHFEGRPLIMNNKLFTSLSAGDKDIVLKAAKEIQDKSMTDQEGLEKQGVQKMKDYGIQVYEFTPAEYKTLADAAVKDVWPAMQSIIGKALLDEATAYYKSLQ